MVIKCSNENIISVCAFKQSSILIKFTGILKHKLGISGFSQNTGLFIN